MYKKNETKRRLRTSWLSGAIAIALLVSSCFYSAGCDNSNVGDEGVNVNNNSKPNEVVNAASNNKHGDLVSCSSDEGCSDNQVCFQNTVCLSKERVCEILACDTKPGVCDLARDTSKCVPALRCEKDLDCNSKQYCNKGTCAYNSCIDNVCPRGICTNANGCEDKSPCLEDRDCLQGKLCIKNGGKKGECRPESDPCNGTCTVSQICQHTKGSSNAICIGNPLGCDNTTMCGSGKICNHDSICVDVNDASLQNCAGDTFDEMNVGNDSNHSIDLLGASSQPGTIDKLTLCQGDEDWFLYHVEANSGSSTDFILITVTVDAKDVGRKNILVDVLKPDNTIQQSKPLSEKDDIVQVKIPWKAGDYKIKVYDEDKTSKLSVGYSIIGSIMSQDRVTICQNAEELPLNQRVNGDFFSTIPAKTGFSCAQALSSELPRSVVYKFVLKDKSLVNLSVQPIANSNAGGDLAIVLKKDCESDSEVICEDSRSVGETESFTKLMDAGTYYIYVTASSQAATGPFKIFANVERTACRPHMSVCADDSSLLVCNATETGMAVKTCLLGCDRKKHMCRSEDADICEYAKEVPENVTYPYKFEIPIAYLRDDYNPSNACSGIKSQTATNGKDAVVKVKVPSGKTLTAEVVAAGKTSLYLSESCSKLNEKCLVGSEAPVASMQAQKLGWKNTSTEDKEIYLFIDYDSTSYVNVSKASVELNIIDSVCEPREKRCDLDRGVLTCNEFGSAWDGDYIDCGENRCEDGKCVVKIGDNCGSPIEVAFNKGGVYSTSASFLNYTDANESSGFCNSQLNWSSIDSGYDVFYRFTTQANKVYRFNLKSINSNYDVKLWFARDNGSELACVQSTIAKERCLGGTDMVAEGRSMLDPETYLFFSDKSMTYYAVVESNNATSKNGAYQLEIREEDAPGHPLSRGTCKNNKMIYYDENGLEKEFECDCNDNNKYCTNSSTSVTGLNGDSCFDSELLAVQTTEQTKTVVSPDVNKIFLGEVSQGKVDHCINFSIAKDIDRFFRFELQENDVLHIKFANNPQNLSEYQIFLMKEDDCVNPNKCEVGKYIQEKGELTYKAPKTGTFIFAVKRVSSAKGNDSGYSFKYFKTSDECPANQFICEGGTTLKRCTANGTFDSVTIDCPDGCEDGYCKPNKTFGATCKDAIEVPTDSNGNTHVYYAQDRKNNTVLGGTACLPTVDILGRGIVYKVHANSGKTITASASAIVSGGVMEVSIFKDCADMYHSCVGGNLAEGKLGSSNTSSLSYYAKDEGDYYILVTQYGDAKGYSDLVGVEITVENGCDPASEPIFENDGFKVCIDGKLQKVTCTVKNNSCQTPSGKFCQDAKTLPDNDPNKDTTLRLSGKLTNEPPIDAKQPSRNQFYMFNDLSGDCLFQSESFDRMSGYPYGGESYYVLDLNEGERLDAVLSVAEKYFDNYIFYLIDSCKLNEQKCLADAVKVSDPNLTTLKLSYTVNKTGKYYLVVDSKNEKRSWGGALSPHLSYNLSYSVKKAESNTGCVPFESFCEDKDTLKICNAEGTEYVTSTCVGLCKDGYCKYDVSRMNTCSTAPLINPTTPALGKKYDVYKVYVPLARNELTPSLITPMTLGACFDNNDMSKGGANDAFLTVNLPKYSKVDVYGMQSKFANTNLFVISDCESSLLASCLAAASKVDYSGSASLLPKHASYLQNSSPNKVVRVGIGGTSENNNTNRKFLVQVTYPTCDIDNFVPKCGTGADSGKLQYCNYERQKQWYDCEAAKCTPSGSGSVADQCETHQGDICDDAIAIDLTSVTSTTITGVLSKTLSPDYYHLEAGNKCTNTKEYGHEKIYAVVVPAGKKLVAELASTANHVEDLALYAATNCRNIPTSCIGERGGSDKKETNGPTEPQETIQYTNGSTTPVTINVVVDSFLPISDGQFKLDFKITDP